MVLGTRVDYEGMLQGKRAGESDGETKEKKKVRVCSALEEF